MSSIFFITSSIGFLYTLLLNNYKILNFYKFVILKST
uniref:Uncharacterized protein n=1 Tax=Myoviridae sp. ctk251 TaxID=2826689 RepID=A0A8S5MSK2_9CAUD|nr:MAG TPA: hypothetical protein [Myoviridae sp. ctk251]